MTELRADIILEQTLGHVTHGQNLQRLLPQHDDFAPRFVLVPFEPDERFARIPGYGNWTIRSGVRARRLVGALPGPRADVRFVHTQVPAVLLGKHLRDVPTVVSLDATPRQYDELGEHYRHGTGPAALERLKLVLNQRCYDDAAHLVTWAGWTKQGLVDEYGVDPDRVTVIPPGVDVEFWRRPRGEADADRHDEVVRVLFVGGDLQRKGGLDLIAAFREVRRRHGDRVELHLVTPTPVDPDDGVTVHSGLKPNTDELISLYQRCDVFCLPTYGDCLPMVLPEAAALGLATVSTPVGAIPEIVRPDETGLLVEVGAVAELAAALDRLVSDHELRSRLGSTAADLVDRDHDAAKNASRIVDTLRSFG